MIGNIIRKHRKSAIAVGLIIFAVIGFCVGQYQAKRHQVILEVLMCGSNGEDFLFKLDGNGTLEVTFGDGTIDFSAPDFFLEIWDSGSVKLTELQFLELCEMIENIKKEVLPGRIPAWIGRNGGWDVFIRMSGDEYSFQLGISKEDKMEEIVAKLMEFAPIEMPFDYRRMWDWKNERINKGLE